MRIRLEADKIETTQPGDEYRTYRPGPPRAYVFLRIPVWLATFFHSIGAETR